MIWMLHALSVAVQMVQEGGAWDYHLDNKEVAFTNTIRTAFLNYFAEHFTSYEQFVIQPQQSYDQWLRNREQFQNFDKAAFLSDQPPQYWPFYSAFLDSTMFSTFIDSKIVSFWEPQKASQELVLFDSKVEAHRRESNVPLTPGN